MTVPARVSLVTLGVEDVARSRAFYTALGWTTARDMDDFVVLRTAGTFVALYPQTELSRDLGRTDVADAGRRTTLAINVASEAEVDAAVGDFVDAGATLMAAPTRAPWGGYTSLVADPDGHVWEVAHNPGWPLGSDGLPRID